MPEQHTKINFTESEPVTDTTSELEVIYSNIVKSSQSSKELRCHSMEKNDHDPTELEEDDLKDPNSERTETKAPDGGYGWFVVLGCFISHVVFAGLDRSEGVLFLLLTTQYEQSAQLTSWPGSIASTLQLVLGPLANVISSRFSVRVSVMLGAVFMFLGLLLSSFAPNIYVYFITHAFIGGIGRGISYVPGLVIVGMYFDKRASLATGFATAGSGLGTFAIVPLTQFLVHNYDFRGTFIILAGFSCHMFISAMLYRPLNMHLRILHATKRTPRIMLKDRNELTENEGSSVLIHTEKSTVHTLSTCEMSKNDMEILQIESKSITYSNNEKRSNGDNNDNCLVSSLKICFPVHKGSKKSRNVLRLGLLKNPSFLMFCVSIFLFTMAFRAAFTFIPALVESKGIPKSQSALAVSAAGAVDTFGRVAFGILLDNPRLRPFRLAFYNLVTFGVAVVAFLLPLLNSLTSFCIMCGLYGLFTGAYISQKSVVLNDILEIQDVPSSFGILMVFQGAGNLLGPPLSGIMKDSFGSFDESFYLGGGLLVIAGLLMVLCNIFNNLQKRKKTGTKLTD